MSTGGEVANALVCKTSIHGFNSHSVLQQLIPIFPVKPQRNYETSELTELMSAWM